MPIETRISRKFRVFYIENDSVDGTRRILRDYEQRFPGLLIGKLLDNVSSVASHKLCSSHGNTAVPGPSSTARGERHCWHAFARKA